MPLTENKEMSNPLKRKHKSVHVSFNEDDEVINPGKILHFILTQVFLHEVGSC